MSFLIIPVAPLYRSKSRLEDCLTRSQLKELTIAMLEDLGNTISRVNCFDEKIVYSESKEILELTKTLGLVGVKEEKKNPMESFDKMICNLDRIIIEKYDPESTVIAFLDLVLISAENFLEFHALMNSNNLVVCPAIQSAGISMLGRRPPIILNSCFSNPRTPSLIALFNNVKDEGISNVAIYDSFRASFDVDITKDLILAYEYMKILNLKENKTYKFLEKNLKYSLHKKQEKNNRELEIYEK